MSKSSGTRCSCGGVMRQEVRFDSLIAKDRIWLVCPFCQSQQPTGQEAETQSGDAKDQVLTQPTRG